MLAVTTRSLSLLLSKRVDKMSSECRTRVLCVSLPAAAAAAKVKAVPCKRIAHKQTTTTASNQLKMTLL